eukprot:12794916-Ditylum_brightwellii.AAC.1
MQSSCIQTASVAVGSYPKILHQTCTSKKGGPCHGQSQNKKAPLSPIYCGQSNAVSTSTSSVKIRSLKEHSEEYVGVSVEDTAYCLNVKLLKYRLQDGNKIPIAEGDKQPS